MNRITIEEFKSLAKSEESNRLEKERIRRDGEAKERLEKAPRFLEYFEEIVFGAKILTLKENGNFDLFGYEVFPYQAGIPIKVDPDDKYKDCRGYVLAWREQGGNMIYDLESAYKFIEERNFWKEAASKNNDGSFLSFLKFLFFIKR